MTEQEYIDAAAECMGKAERVMQYEYEATNARARSFVKMANMYLKLAKHVGKQPGRPPVNRDWISHE